MAWKTISQTKECVCGSLVFKKVMTEYVRIKDISNYTKEGKSTGGHWDEKEEKEGTTIYTCVDCGAELK